MLGKLRAGVVDHDIEAAEPLNDCCDRGFPTIFVRDVLLDEEGVAPGVRDFLDGGEAPLFIEVGNRNLCPFLGEQDGARASQS